MKTCTWMFYHCLMVGCVGMMLSPVARAQSSRRSPVQSTKSLDQAAEKAEMEYLGNLADLASKYEEAGDLKKAGEMLKGILKLKPDADLVKTKLKMFDEAVFEDNSKIIDVDSGAGWVATGILVSKDKPIRIEAEGTYKFSVSDVLSAAGYPGQDLVHGLMEGIPCGGLMAVIGKSNDSGGRRVDPKDLPKPMFVGTKAEIKPNESGPLLLRVNVPEGAKCTGKLKVRITGNIVSLGN